jgi:hypothetical protein
VADPRLLPNPVDRKPDPMCDAVAFDLDLAALLIKRERHGEDSF